MHAFFRRECAVTGVSLSVDTGLGASWAFLHSTKFRNGVRNAISFRLVTQQGNH